MKIYLSIYRNYGVWCPKIENIVYFLYLLHDIEGHSRSWSHNEGLPVAEQGDGEEEEGADKDEGQEDDESEVARAEIFIAVNQLVVRTGAG